jgi:hypothetical protein
MPALTSSLCESISASCGFSLKVWMNVLVHFISFTPKKLAENYTIKSRSIIMTPKPRPPTTLALYGIICASNLKGKVT